MTTYYRKQYRSKRNKFGVSPAASRTYNNITYHSKKEAGYAQHLDLLIKAKEIKSWERQVKISLDVNGYHITNYYMDFVVTHLGGILEYIEVKGFETMTWKMKYKLFEALYDQQVKDGTIILTVVK